MVRSRTNLTSKARAETSASRSPQKPVSAEGRGGPNLELIASPTKVPRKSTTRRQDKISLGNDNLRRSTRVSAQRESLSATSKAITTAPKATTAVASRKSQVKRAQSSSAIAAILEPAAVAAAGSKARTPAPRKVERSTSISVSSNCPQPPRLRPSSFTLSPLMATALLPLPVPAPAPVNVDSRVDSSTYDPEILARINVALPRAMRAETPVESVPRLEECVTFDTVGVAFNQRYPTQSFAMYPTFVRRDSNSQEEEDEEESEFAETRLRKVSAMRTTLSF